MKKVLTSIAAFALATISAFSVAAPASAKEIKHSTPKYKVVMKNRESGKKFKVKAAYDKEKYDTLKADFYNIPQGSYKIAVYEYDANHTKLLKKAGWSLESFKDAKYDVTTYFYTITKDVEVHTNWITSKHLNLKKINSRYKVVAKNRKTHEFFERNLSLNFNRYDAYLTQLDGLSRGKYDVKVYKLNSNGKKVKRVAKGTFNCKVAKGLLGYVNIDYFPVAKAVDTTLDYAHKDSHDFTVVMQNKKTGKTYQAQTGIDFNRYDTDYAIVKHVPAGKYKILVYTLNSNGGNNSLCASTSYKVKKNSNIKVSYYPVPSTVEAEVYKVSK